MPSNKNAIAALSAIDTDKAKILGVKVGKHIVAPGQFIPKSGTLFYISQVANETWS